MKAFVPFLVLPLFVSSLAAQKTKLTDLEATQAYEDSLLQYLKDGQYDALEDQFEEVQDRSIQTQDGTPKIWYILELLIWQTRPSTSHWKISRR
jgi:hypothetical protein